MATSWPGLPLPSLLVLSISLTVAAAASHESMIYPEPHGEAFRSLSLALSLIGPSYPDQPTARLALFSPAHHVL